MSPHAIVRTGIRALLDGADGVEVASGWVNPETAAPGTASLPPTWVLLVDSLCARTEASGPLLRTMARPWLRVIVVARSEEPGLTDRLLDLGVDGCLPMNSTRGAFHRAVSTGATHPLNPFPASRSEQIDALTAREVEILALIARGHSNIEIARRLFLSVNTVKSHVRTAYCRIGVHSRTQAVLWGVENRVSDIARRRSSTDLVRLTW